MTVKTSTADVNDRIHDSNINVNSKCETCVPEQLIVDENQHLSPIQNHPSKTGLHSAFQLTKLYPIQIIIHNMTKKLKY